MTEIIGVRFKDGGKVYYFNPNGVPVEVGQHVIIETSKGIEFGECALANTMVDEMELIAALRPMLRIATEEDMQRVEANHRNEKRAFAICQEKILEHKLEMKLVEVKYSFDGSKILFFFTADGRVDFRHLVKDLAAVFRTRIELRQIGVRDEAKIMGGLGVCGRPFCCSQFLNDFQPVSIKMAKTQNISLNPTKISGVCGRLMCCLKYEQDAYEDLLKDTPKLESLVETPDGVGVVNQIQLLREQVRVVLDQDPDTPKLYHKSEIDIIRNGKGKRPPGYEFPVQPPEHKTPAPKLIQEPHTVPVSEPAENREKEAHEKRENGTSSSHHSRRNSNKGQSQRKDRPVVQQARGTAEQKSGEKKQSGSRSRRHHATKKSQSQPVQPHPAAEGKSGTGQSEHSASSRPHRRRHHRPRGHSSSQSSAPKTEK